jgi:hypothetical protein
MKMEPTDCPETSVSNYKSQKRDIQQERRSDVILKLIDADN